MTEYIESFNILGRTYGIEDYKDGADHFFPELKKNGRYHLWHGGCGIGYAKTLKQAREGIYDHARSRLFAQLDHAKSTVEACETALKTLGDDPSYLFKFSKDAP